MLLVSFGAPEGPEDVAPFLANVTRGREVPEERLREVAAHYLAVGGVSPLAGANRDLLARLQARLAPLPVYWGNRNWHPLLADTLARMRDDGVQHAYAFVTSAVGSYSGCRQYREDIERARQLVGPGAPVVEKLRLYYNHPLFVAAQADRVRQALDRLGAAADAAVLLFTAHSVPMAMARGSAYVEQLREASGLVAAAAAPQLSWELVWQSRSGPPQVPWLEPDVGAALAALAERGAPAVVLVPVGFVSDHMEVVHDLDVEAAAEAQRLGLALVRAATVGEDPRFVELVAELLAERREAAPRRWLGTRGPSHDTCPSSCCLPGRGQPVQAEAP